MIKEKCQCGATFEITSGDKDFQSSRYTEFLRAHEVCRKKEAATTTNSREPVHKASPKPCAACEWCVRSLEGKPDLDCGECLLCSRREHDFTDNFIDKRTTSAR